MNYSAFLIPQIIAAILKPSLRIVQMCAKKTVKITEKKVVELLIVENHKEYDIWETRNPSIDNSEVCS
jgi:hypothetical protein